MFARSIFFPVLMVCLAATAGCGKRADVKREAAELEKAFASASPAPGTDSAQDAIQERAAAVVAALKSRDYAAASDQLMALQRLKGLTAEQRMTVNHVSGTLVQELMARSAKGDAQAKAALERRKKERAQR
jgi:hypothetical protein